MLKNWFFIIGFIGLNALLNAQVSYDYKVIDPGNIGIFITNSGTFGRPDVRNTPTGEPSMEYPINSGIEHLFEGGIWIGALVDGQYLVSLLQRLRQVVILQVWRDMNSLRKSEIPLNKEAF